VNDTLVLVLGLLAEEQQPRDTGPDFGKASPFGLLVVVLLLLGTFFLIWSMNRHLRNLPETFDRDRPEPDQAADDDGSVGFDGDADTESKPREPGG
jgi:hypothetical protein